MCVGDSNMQVQQKPTPVLSELKRVHGRLDHLEDLVSDILESGREMDANLTDQLEEVRYEIAMQHETLKKLKKTYRCSYLHKLLVLFVFVVAVGLFFMVRL